MLAFLLFAGALNLNLHALRERAWPVATLALVGTAVSTAVVGQVRKSITPDALISFIDGKPYKTLKRHLSAHGLDPYSYCQRYGLPNDYPMVAAAYAARRSELAKSIGLRRPGAMADGKNLEESGRKGRRTDQRTKLSDVVRSTKRSQMAG
ncbi:UNVERIFIED_ORG: putative transcriptional regulator [Methylobacterium sp. SuP10 SLI 274]|uniref:MucR family transcriptional regulator n=1 Tax=Methylorubrum extorquens TaxID=408 RepID=UPI00209EACBE|nr:MucR family transcriptional regulator [Methylorubrum extorquens]MDF9863224.1 putative transcriptional regulator [Methylorubrum pseudosasae]MDH6636836.1 putative transcriptional regulator [Methylobacterium sp. SuP10 SLI 274]MDH6666012.1 putative transcriptional regulator [Methylorubrum zatmanii]MCP1557927.1 putative transcriptional regulator [Methylorubrum extorquens]MDF9791532.1 putative transcriptional regulator [Methylorubrum extorquens]